MNFYQVLGVKATAPEEVILDAYERAFEPGMSVERQLEVHMAKTVLTDPAKRAQHDAELLAMQKRPTPARKPQRALALTPPTPVVMHEYHHHYPTIVHQEDSTISLLKTGFVWFILAMASVSIFFLMALVR